MIDESTTTETQTEPEKQTNRTFTQSELDSFIAKEKNALKEKFSDYDTVKAEHEKLLAEQKEKEMANMSELDRYKTMLADNESKRKEVEAENQRLQRLQIKTDVLNMSKYSALPSVYKKAIDAGESQEIVIESAEKVYAEYLTDFGKDKTVADNFESNTESQEPKMIVPAMTNDALKQAKDTFQKKLLGRLVN
jgi:hypothetical protein